MRRGGVTMNEEARGARRQEKRQKQMLRKRARGAGPELSGIDAKYSSCAPNFTNGFSAPGMRSMMSLEMLMTRNMVGLLLERMGLSV